ncbi:dihydrolipoamide acetyltransferase [Aliidiomarina sedimenti]|uniref:Dihydrolipoamide acetyltransferase component of pyruvate dehydrogenase complex n=1 Tax=Aliidiomarina sedimenti TaxID=1933879 RepID=A0ABY0BX15_9GAMM|nr:dihydrolipoyllysine-residue acetyltransferase [Aliidiomarina sedimenti]RUO28808.1 dihydrolipoamide acetyltransferase [Aliidiomarina sedimenti]
MSTDFILPDIGEGIVECEIVEWVVAEGDSVKEDQVVVEVMTDKAVVEIPAKSDGVVVKHYYAKGDVAKVGEALFAIDEEGSSSSEETAESKPQPKEPADSSADEIKATASEESPQSSGHSNDFILPDIGEGIVECEIVEWHVQQGDQVKEDQVVVEVMTDKAVVEIPAKTDGVVSKLYHAKGEIAKVGDPLFALQGTGDVAADAPAKASSDTAASNKAASATEAPKAASQGKALASPAVRRRAREAGIDIAAVPGSGSKGRVLKEDIQSYVEGGKDKPAPAQATSSPSKATGGSRTEPLKGVKAAMAKLMAESVRTIPHFTYAEEFDLTELRAMHKKLKAKYADKGVKLTLMPFFIKALSLALKEYPIMNAQLNDEASEITYFEDHNIGMAVATKIGLMVPNIKGVQNMTLLQVAEEVTRLTNAARDGKVAQADMKGGTITISNIGVVGGTVTTPIINKPEAAIVALGKVQSLPRFDEQGAVVARDIMTASWSGDHRIIDGATVANFNNRWKEFLEDPSSMLVEMA